MRAARRGFYGSRGRAARTTVAVTLLALAALATLAALAMVTLLTGARAGASARLSAHSRQPLATCFWEGPISMRQPTTSGYDGHYFGFPEKSATYWLARFNLPTGATLALQGSYAHARYQSLNAYSSGSPTDSLPDFKTVPDPGSTNPFIAGNPRHLPNRSYAVNVLNATPPSDPSMRAPNTLYASPGQSGPIEILYRVYEPDRRLDLSGGEGLPAPLVTLAGGSTLSGQAACAAVNDPNRTITVQTTPASQWQTFENAPGCTPASAPAVDPLRWNRFFNFDYARLRVAVGCTAQAQQLVDQAPHADTGGFYSNGDIRYLYGFASRQFGQLLVVQGKMPTVPRTYEGEATMGTGQLRYWSLCSAESAVTDRTEDCLADRQVPVDTQRDFTIVVSRPEDRPSNATTSCGVAWLGWSPNGDGAGRNDFATLIVRNMLPSPSFAEAIQNISNPGTEQAVTGPYYPRPSYTTIADFEARGCPAAEGGTAAAAEKTGRRSAALKKCKRKQGKIRKRCKRRAHRLPV